MNVKRTIIGIVSTSYNFDTGRENIAVVILGETNGKGILSCEEYIRYTWWDSTIETPSTLRLGYIAGARCEYGSMQWPMVL